MTEEKPQSDGKLALESAFAQEMHRIYQRALSEALYHNSRRQIRAGDQRRLRSLNLNLGDLA